MCDIYTDHCRGCGTPIEMHLGDFETSPLEISVFCEKCITPYDSGIGEVPFGRAQSFGLHAVPHCIWKCKGRGPKGTIAVVALTENAWANRAMNHPNSAKPKMISESKKGE